MNAMAKEPEDASCAMQVHGVFLKLFGENALGISSADIVEKIRDWKP